MCYACHRRDKFTRTLFTSLSWLIYPCAASCVTRSYGALSVSHARQDFFLYTASFTIPLRSSPSSVVSHTTLSFHASALFPQRATLVMLRAQRFPVAAPLYVALTRTVRLATTTEGPGSRDAAKMTFGVDSRKLDLDLDLDNMDFDVIMNETRRALAKERGGHANFQAEIETLNAALKKADAPVESAGPSDRARRSIRGIAMAGAVHDANTPQAAYEQARRERAEANQPRYTLVDSLRDSCLTGNWAKAYEMFETAVAKGVQQAGGATPDEAPQPGSEAEARCFEKMKNVNATLPDAGGFRARKNLQGILRWNSNHVYWVTKALFSSDRLTEAQRVWSVLKAIGFLEYRIDARTLNGLISLVRATSTLHASSTDPSQLVEPLLAAHTKTSEQIDREKAFRREMTMTLESVAQSRHIPLGPRNQKTAQRARIADAIRRGDGDFVGDTAAHDGSTEPPSLQVGDFTGLLRVSQSEESSDRVLAMMEKLNVPKSGETYAALVAALHNPSYRLKCVDPNDIVAGPSRRHATAVPQRRSAQAESLPSTDEAGSDGTSGVAAELDEAALDGEAEDDECPEADPAVKDKYEAYKEQRIAAARKWFHTCPEADRTATLFNEMLYLLRSRTHKDSFDALLVEFRGAPVRTVEEEAFVTSPADGGEQVPPIQPPQWRVAPNGKTFELLIQRSRYLHDWSAMWDLYEEMVSRDVPGTRKLYQALLVEARRHPPQKILKRKRMDTSAFIMRLYKEMQRNHVDVRSMGSTMSVVNAWSATRSQRRWN